MASSFPQEKASFFTLDRVALGAMVALFIVIGLMIWSGDRTVPKVRDFSWASQRIGAEDRAFILTFNRPMDIDSVERNLRISPPLPGKISWAGRRMAYTLTLPAPYSTQFSVALEGARDRFSDNPEQAAPIEPFLSQFRTRDRAFAYIGTTGDEEGRLVLYNFTQEEKRILSPANLVVREFKGYPQGDRILFAATDRTTYNQGKFDQKLYVVGTGANGSPQDDNPTPELVLDSGPYQNLKFDLSPDGQTIIVQRVKRDDPSEFGFWKITGNKEPVPFDTEPGGEFLITPDSKAVAMAQGQGVAIVPLKESDKQTDTLDFLPKYGTVLSFAPDGTQAAMVKFNTDRTRSLFLVTNQGSEVELLRTTGSIRSVTFDPLQQQLYCLLTELIEDPNAYREQPYIATVNLKTKEETKLVQLPQQPDVRMSLAPDGLALLFDRSIRADAAQQSKPSALRNDAGEAIATSQLWLLPLTPPDAETGKTLALQQPELLPFEGFRPVWLP